MAERNKIGIVFNNYGGLWTGGTYYILNLISALNKLPESKKPELIIFAENEEEFEMVLQTGYNLITRSGEVKKLQKEVYYNFAERVINKIGSIFFSRNVIEKRPTRKDINFIFPIIGAPYFKLPGKHFYNGFFFEKVPKVYWIPDFQEKYLPEFFPESELKFRKEIQSDLSKKNITIVFSSRDAENDFRKFYPASIAKTFVLNFAVTHPDYSKEDTDQLKKQYNISRPYFFSPNQFWKHKNHFTVLKAVKELKERNADVLVVFSGKESDLRNPDYFPSLKEYVKNENLEDNIIFAGFLDRKVQLALMKGAIAIIQPSLFEGWSTVVEDAKAMNQFMIASDLRVHKEQLQTNAMFFDPGDPKILASQMEIAMKEPPVYKKSDYNKSIEKFAEDFLQVPVNN